MSMYQEKTVQDFSNWLNSGFLKRNPNGWTPVNLDKWFTCVNKGHTDIRSLLKDNIVQKNYYIASGQKEIDIESNAVQTLINKLLALEPSFLKNLALTKEDFKLPTIANGTHNARKLSKELSRYFRDVFYNKPTVLAEVDKIISTLGELWAKSKTNACDLEITLSTNAKAFALLGHYGPDKDSCFRQGSTSPYDKWIFAQSKNTFVISVSKANEKKKLKRENVARALGWFENNTFHVRNYYFSPGFHEGDFLELLSLFFSELLNTKVIMRENYALLSNTSYNGWTFYQNNYGNWSFGSNPQESYLDLNLNGILCHECEKCHRKFKDDKHFKNIDTLHVCDYCYNVANVCEVSGIRTFEELVPIIDAYGNEISVHSTIAATYKKCTICNNHSSSLFEIENDNICHSCLATDYSYCEIGNHYVKDSQILDIGDITCCKNHKKDIESEMIEEILTAIE